MACRALLTLFIIFLLIPGQVLSAGGVGNGNEPESGPFVVQGLGYPPIRAQSEAQARLMARRAAVIDAYRNALASRETKDREEGDFLSGLQGFVKGMTIIKEEYLEDGGIRVTARVTSDNAASRNQGRAEIVQGQTSGPFRVSQDEWYGIIKKLVKIGK